VIVGAKEVCGPGAAETRRLVGAMARGLESTQFSRFWLTDLDGDEEAEFLVQYDLGDVGDRYVAFFAFKWNGTKYDVVAASWFLEGSLHAVRVFGPTETKKAFVRFLSCTECHPWVYLVACDFLVPPVGAAFEFSYNVDAGDSWGLPMPWPPVLLQFPKAQR